MSDPGKTAFLASVHVSTSNVISYTLITSAAMLTFFFAFQGALLAFYVSVNWPMGKIVNALVCILAIIFNVWSYKIVRIAVDYLTTYIDSGAELEKTGGCTEGGIYTSIKATFDRPENHYWVFRWTVGFIACLTLTWAVLLLLALIGSRP